jgi:hypothetical protein
VGALTRSRASILAALATLVALASVWHSGRHMWESLERSYDTYSAFSDVQRRHAAIEALGLNPEVFDFYARYVVPGDRIYYQVQESGLGRFVDLPTAVRYVGHFYLLPAVEARDLDDATVVVTLFEDPAKLGRRFVTQQRAGLQPFLVSRISAP